VVAEVETLKQEFMMAVEVVQVDSVVLSVQLAVGVH